MLREKKEDAYHRNLDWQQNWCWFDTTLQLLANVEFFANHLDLVTKTIKPSDVFIKELNHVIKWIRKEVDTNKPSSELIQDKLYNMLFERNKKYGLMSRLKPKGKMQDIHSFNESLAQYLSSDNGALHLPNYSFSNYFSEKKENIKHIDTKFMHTIDMTSDTTSSAPENVIQYNNKKVFDILLSPFFSIHFRLAEYGLEIKPKEIFESMNIYSRQFTLVGMGAGNGGHVTALVKNKKTKHWIFFNDMAGQEHREIFNSQTIKSIIKKQQYKHYYIQMLMYEEELDSLLKFTMTASMLKIFKYQPQLREEFKQHQGISLATSSRTPEELERDYDKKFSQEYSSDELKAQKSPTLSKDIIKEIKEEMALNPKRSNSALQKSFHQWYLQEFYQSIESQHKNISPFSPLSLLSVLPKTIIQNNFTKISIPQDNTESLNNLIQKQAKTNSLDLKDFIIIEIIPRIAKQSTDKNQALKLRTGEWLKLPSFVKQEKLTINDSTYEICGAILYGREHYTALAKSDANEWYFEHHICEASQEVNPKHFMGSLLKERSEYSNPKFGNYFATAFMYKRKSKKSDTLQKLEHSLQRLKLKSKELLDKLAIN
jgi:hypothetical protein